MKIAIPVDQSNIETTISTSFGRAPFYLIYDTKDNSSTFITNTAAMASGGAGIKAAQLIVDQDVKALITPRLGDNAAKVLMQSNISLYKSSVASAKASIDALIAGTLEKLTHIHPGHHGSV